MSQKPRRKAVRGETCDCCGREYRTTARPGPEVKLCGRCQHSRRELPLGRLDHGRDIFDQQGDQGQ